MLTIGLPCYKDYPMVWATVQALRLYQDLADVEILVVDNAGDPATKQFMDAWAHRQGKEANRHRYIERLDCDGPAAVKNAVFEEAKGDWVLCIDAHVLLAPGSVARLKAWAASHADSGDLYAGPLAYDGLDGYCAVDMTPTWGSGMWGQWVNAFIGVDDDPREIWGNGGGLLCCRKDAWLGFNPDFKGFGGEEGYIHEKFRKHGHKVVLLPFLQWCHHFRQGSAPYNVDGRDKLRNYLIGFRELGLDTTALNEHFGAARVAAVGI